MCSQEEMQKIVNDSEKRIEARIDSKLKLLEEKVMDKVELSHTSVAKTISNLGGELNEGMKEMSKSFDNLSKLTSESIQSIKIRSVNWDNTTKIVYGLVALILTSVITALVAVIIKVT